MDRCLPNINANEHSLLPILTYYVTDRITIWNRNLKCIYANKAVLDYYEQVDFSTHSLCLYDFPYSVEFKQKWAERMQHVFSTAKIAIYDDVDIIDNKETYTRSIVIPTSDSPQKISSLIVILKDITEQRTLEKEFLLNSKLAELGKTFTYLTHEIKIPLNSIMMNIDILSQDEQVSESQKHSTKIVRKELKRLNQLIRDILKHTKITEYKSTNINLQEIFTNIMNLMGPELKSRRISFKVNISEVFILGTEQDLTSVFLSLVSNAVEAIGEDGAIEIYSSKDDKEKTISIFIRDSGGGVTEQNKIFAPFYTTKKNGHGIGLPQAKRLLSKMHSSIRLESSKPGCTIFEVILNLSKVLLICNIFFPEFGLSDLIFV